MPDQLLDRELRLYVDVSQQWKADHQEALGCYKFEDILARGVQVFGLIVNTDENWRAAICAGRIQFEEAARDEILAAFRLWLQPCDAILQHLAYFEGAGFDVKHAYDFRSCVRECQGILTPDEQFFVDDRLVELRDEALDQHRDGNCLEHRAS